MRFSFSSLALVVVLAVGTPAQAQGPSYEERSLGAATAPVQVIEYSSLLCSHCATFHKDILPQIKKEYIDTGKVRWVFRDHSLGSPLALGAAMITRCAPMDTYYPLMGTLFANQRAWASAPNPMEALQSYAALAGMDKDAVAACLDSESVFKGIRDGEAEAEAAGVDSTPSFLINGKPVIVGAQSVEQFRAVLDPLLAAKK
ncbi:DsbA family protein [Pararhodospirillum photometricum]|uniref:DsbA family protein n=1 Tax=Pararhodospirillum photometricum TaxID=1084 RepID=UPI0002D322F1|nr:thioredoxin domain-containing protein [Pararhodospirillum photometricum]